MDGNKVWGIHPATNNKVELVPGFKFVSFDSTQYVTGGWEKNKKTGAPELAVFEADGNNVYLGREERVPPGTVLDLGEDPFVTKQEEWRYVKAPLITQDSFNPDTQPDEHDAVQERINQAKARMAAKRKANAEKKAATEKVVNADKVIDKVESYDKRVKDTVKEAPTEETLDKMTDAAMDDIVELEEQLASDSPEIRTASQAISNAVKSVEKIAPEDPDDDLDDDIDDLVEDASNGDLNNWLDEVENTLSKLDTKGKPKVKGTVTKGRPPMSARRTITKPKPKPKQKRRRKPKRKEKATIAAANRKEEFKVPHKSKTGKLKETLDDTKAVKELAYNYQSLDQRLKNLEANSSFRNAPNTIANPTMDTHHKPVSTSKDVRQNGMAMAGQFGSAIQAVKQLDEAKIIENAALIAAICEMDETTKAGLLTVIAKLQSGTGIVVL